MGHCVCEPQPQLHVLGLLRSSCTQMRSLAVTRVNTLGQAPHATHSLVFHRFPHPPPESSMRYGCVKRVLLHLHSHSTVTPQSLLLHSHSGYSCPYTDGDGGGNSYGNGGGDGSREPVGKTLSSSEETGTICSSVWTALSAALSVAGGMWPSIFRRSPPTS